MELNFADFVSTLARAVGLVFGYATIAKLANLNAVIDGMRSYGLIPNRLLPLAVSLLIIGEALIAITHLGLVALPLASPATVALLAIFLGFSAYSLLRGENRPCLCFGAKKDDKVDGSTLARIIGLLAAETAVLAAVMNTGAQSLQSTGAVTSVESLVAALVIVTLASLIITAPDFIMWWRLRPKGLLLRPQARSERPTNLTDPLHLN